MIFDMRSGGHPAGGSAADDHDLADAVGSHKTISGARLRGEPPADASICAMNSLVGRQASARFRGSPSAHLLERRGDLVLVKCVGNRLIVIGHDALAEHDRDPAGRCEQLQLVAEHARLGAPQLDLALRGCPECSWSAQCFQNSESSRCVAL